MKLTLITILILIFIMCIIQLFFRDGFSIMNQEKFREDNINYYYDKFIVFPTDGRERECNVLKNNKLKKSKICEGYQKMENTIYHEKVEKCKVVNDVKDWRNRISKIPEDVIDGEKGCGFCFDDKKVYYGDSTGPFGNIGKKMCKNWIKPGEVGKGGTSKSKNIFAKYPNPINSFKDMFRKEVNKGVKYDSKKMHEQEICKSVVNCGQLAKYKRPDGTPLCGWCFSGRKGDGDGEGMVRKGGNGPDQNEPKYKDDYCPWPREIQKKDGNYFKTGYYKTPNAKEFAVWKEKKKVSDNAKLLKNAGECKELEQMFPCFKNFMGKKSGGHSEECYNQIWKDEAQAKFGCNGVIDRRVRSNLPYSSTFKTWNNAWIPSVEQAINNIGEKAKTSIQYDRTYDQNKSDHPRQNLSSSLLNNLTCYGKRPNPCDDRFRQKKYNYPRPKECIDSILRNIGLPKTHPRYNPKNSSTYSYYWPVQHDKSWRTGVHYDWSNKKFRNKLIQQKRIYNNISRLFNANGLRYNFKSSAIHPLDNIYLSSLYLYGKIMPKLKLWQDNDGGMKKLWVKMCYEDFADELKKFWAKNDNNFINSNGKVDLSRYMFLKNKLMKNANLLTVKASNGVNMELRLENNRYITKQVYEHPNFPFWRVIPKDYYLTYIYKRIQKKENTMRGRASCSQLSNRYQCNRNKTCNYWGGKCRPKLVLVNKAKSISSAKKTCEKKYGGKLAKMSGSNYNYIRNFFYRNRWRFMRSDKYYKPVNRGNNPRYKLPECNGDCDRNSDCKGGNICLQKSYTRSRNYLRVPGCKTTKFSRVRGSTRSLTTHDWCINPKKTEMRLKYYSAWPHCSNIRCHSNIRLKTMKRLCNRDGMCHGFSWTKGRNRDWQKGGGCLKKYCLGKPGRRGYGRGSHGYYERRTKYNRVNDGVWVGKHNRIDKNGKKKSAGSGWWSRYKKKKAICELDYDGR